MTARIHFSRKWILLAIKLTGITALGAACLLFLSVKIARTADAIEQARNSHAAFNAKYEQLDRLRDDEERIKPHRTRLESAIPPVDSFPVIADYINAVSTKTSNITVARFDPIPVLNEQELRELSFSLQVQGSLLTVRNFLAELETAPYFITIRSMSVILTNSLEGQATAELAGVVYLKDMAL